MDKRAFPIIVVWFFMVSQTDQTVLLDISLAKIGDEPGSSLTINCTHLQDFSSNIAHLVSLSLWKMDVQVNSSRHFQEIVSISSFAANVATIVTPVTGSVSGHVSKDGQSFLSVHWTNVSVTEAGLYLCNASGIDRSNNCVDMSKTAFLSAEKLSSPERNEQCPLQIIESIDTKFAAINSRLESLENVLNNDTQNKGENDKFRSELLDDIDDKFLTLKRTLTSLEDKLSIYTKEHDISIADITRRLDILEEYKTLVRDNSRYEGYLARSGDYEGRRYQLHNFTSKYAEYAELACALKGGYLARISNSSEYEFITAFLNSSAPSFVRFALIGGYKKQGSKEFLYRNTEDIVDYFVWKNDLKNQHLVNEEKCLLLRRDSGWKMSPEVCWTYNPTVTYICEIVHT